MKQFFFGGGIGFIIRGALVIVTLKMTIVILIFFKFIFAVGY